MSAEARSFDLSVVTPEKAISEGAASFVSLPAHDGEIGILRGRAPLVAKLDVGALRIRRPDGENETWFIDGGFAEMADNRLTVLTEAALRPDELERARVQEELEAARALPAVTAEEFAARQHALKAARVKLALLA